MSEDHRGDALPTNDLWALIEARAELTADGLLAVDERGRRLTFGQYRTAAQRAAAGLSGLGVGPGSTVSWMLPTRHEALVLLATLSRLDAVQNPIIPIYREKEVGFIVDEAGVEFLIVPGVWRGFDYPAMADHIADVRGGRPQIVVCDPDLPDGDPEASALPPRRPAGDDPPIRWLFYTSGTTADPKGAKHTDATILAASSGMAQHLEFGHDDRNGLAFPFTHIGGPVNLGMSLLTGGGNIIMETFVPEQAVAQLAREGVTMAGSGTAFHLGYLAVQRSQPDRPIFPKLRCCLGGGAPKPPHLHYEVQAELGGAGILSGWGLTESPVLTMAHHHDSDEKLATTEGVPLPGVELKVVTLDGRPAEPGEEGELRARAPQVLKGYVDPSLEAAAFDDEGFFRTGDLGFVDREGHVVITGRLKDVIVRNMENISAKEVEDLLYEHPRVTDVAVIGLPDPRTGERACAVVTLGSQPDDEPFTLADVRSHLVAKGLRRQAIPEQLEVLDILPRNAAGKVDRRALIARYRD